jgi:hypothetical protein
MTIVRDYIQDISNADKLQIIDDFAQLELYGYIGESCIRKHTEIVVEKTGVQNQYFVMYMNILANEVFRYFAMKYLKGE